MATRGRSTERRSAAFLTGLLGLFTAQIRQSGGKDAGAGSGLSFIRSTTSQLNAMARATASKPPRNVPVAFRMMPITQGPANPPRFPTELISAMPTAAAVPLRILVGIAQKGPIVENALRRATLIAATD